MHVFREWRKNLALGFVENAEQNSKKLPKKKLTMKSISTAKNQENLLVQLWHRNKQKKNSEIKFGTTQIENLCLAMYKQNFV